MSFYTEQVLQCHQTPWQYQPQQHCHENELVSNVERYRSQSYEVFYDGFQDFSTYASEGSSTTSTPEMYSFNSTKNVPQIMKSQFREPCKFECSYDSKQMYSGGDTYQTTSNVEVITGNILYSNDEEELYDDDSRSSGHTISYEDQERRRRRRERNKVAATKCRHKKKEHVIQLNIESQTLECSNSNLKMELNQLEQERNHLLNLLSNHRPFCLIHIQ